MLPINQLLFTLEHHNIQYRLPAPTNRIALLASKASILEVCGWVEQAIDVLVKDCAIRCSLTPLRLSSVDSYVKRTSGFHYTNHFERMLIAVIGFKCLEQVENSMLLEIVKLKALFNDLSLLRNHYAHTHFDEHTPYPDGRTTVPNPSTMIASALIANSGLSAFELELIRLDY